MAARSSRFVTSTPGTSTNKSLSGVRIAGVGHHAPSRVVSNEDLEQWLDTSDEWITTRTGMKRRHWASDEEATSDLAVVAAQAALDQAGLRPRDIDCFILCTVTPDYYFPATACIVAAKLGAKDTAAFDVSIACSGFIYGLTVGAGLVRSGVYRRVMLIGAETLSKILNKDDRATAILFGDGAGAVILERSEEDSFLAAELGADASKPELLYVEASGSRHPIDKRAIEERQNLIAMQGREVFKVAVNRMIEATDAALAKARLTKADVAFLIPHQANKRIIDAAAYYLEVPEEKVVTNIAEYGNTSAASIPIALSEFVRAGKLKDGDVVIFVAFGGGLSWGAVAWEWHFAPAAS
ncbi:MAG: ketoacyl-ACP synthase III [Candidatus Eremiobacteraeota bacterium]|nr:ketoacyl-ACP synthase III [Candidatus Eremiobacteraeota bacterium]